MRFIVIDDEDINLFIAKKIIVSVLGPQDIITFTSARDALSYLKDSFDNKSDQPAIILLDLNMPVTSGWDFLEFFNQFDDALKSAVQIYIVSSSILPVDKSRASANPNVVAFFSKPLTPSIITSYFNRPS